MLFTKIIKHFCSKFHINHKREEKKPKALISHSCSFYSSNSAIFIWSLFSSVKVKKGFNIKLIFELYFLFHIGYFFKVKKLIPELNYLNHIDSLSSKFMSNLTWRANSPDNMVNYIVSPISIHVLNCLDSNGSRIIFFLLHHLVF